MSPQRIPDSWANRQEASRNPEIQGRPPAEVVDLNGRRAHRRIPSSYSLSELYSIYAPPVPSQPKKREVIVDGNLFMNEQLLAGKRHNWPSYYDKETPGTVTRHPSAPDVEEGRTFKLRSAGSSLGKFIALNALGRSQSMTDDDITGISPDSEL